MKCCGKTTSFFGRCDRPASIIRDGKSYCWQHDPERLRAKAKDKWEKRKVELSGMEAAWDARDLRRQLEERAGIDDLTNDDLRNIASLGGVRSMMDQLKKD